MSPSDSNLKEFSLASREAARLGGDVLLKWLGKVTPQEKGMRDWVTQADLESQTIIREFLLSEFPDHQFIGEESIAGSDAPSSAAPFCWIVDPLDGTTNYVHQLQSFSVSIGLQHNRTTVVGSVFDPWLDEMYYAIKGQGATLNGQPIWPSRRTELEKSLFVMSFPRGVKRDDVEVSQFLNMLENAGSLRRLGSAALNLCYVACGRVDGYWATSLQKWDVAAGWLIATEAGATLADFAGQSPDIEQPRFCVTATPELFEQAMGQLRIDD